MAYTSLTQLTERYGERKLIQLTDRADVASGVIDLAVINRALADTDAQIDGYLAGRYALPLADVPPLVADLAQAIAIWKLHPYTPDDKIRADYETALKTLRDIAAGAVRLPLAGSEPAASGAGGVIVTDRERPLTEETLKGFI